MPEAKPRWIIPTTSAHADAHGHAHSNAREHAHAQAHARERGRTDAHAHAHGRAPSIAPRLWTQRAHAWCFAASVNPGHPRTFEAPISIYATLMMNTAVKRVDTRALTWTTGRIIRTRCRPSHSPTANTHNMNQGNPYRLGPKICTLKTACPSNPPLAICNNYCFHASSVKCCV